ncbi:DNA cytosine methyltransferase [Aspergillus undulatus]|uniref:DNA cytosine methyltransferase n=1 Tax=Aspergillus undulatus TaxID=1810928 RepID=UPI003CCD8BA1
MTDINTLMIIDEDAESDASSVTLDFEGNNEDDLGTDEVLEVLREDWLQSLRAARSTPAPSLWSQDGKYLEEACCDDGIVVKPGQTVELHDDTYLRICHIWEDPTGEIFLQGRRLDKLRPRASDFNHRNGLHLPQWKNEVVWKAYDTENVLLGFVRRFVTVHFTNNCHVKQDPQRAKYPRSLFCRLKEDTQVDSNSFSVEYLTHDEADAEFCTSPATLRRCWRGETAPFGSEEADIQPPVIVLDNAEESEQSDLGSGKRMRRKYTFGDGFCGAGGVSCGADMAGLHPKWAFDICPQAAATYRLNFATSVCEESDIFSFLANNEKFLRVDITHGSPPCQTFSPAKTRASANDDANSACIFSCGDLIRKAKPRVHTMEETSGLIDRHQEYFRSVVRDFIESGYSVRWAILICKEHGVPQKRKRLVVIASGPGETLPAMPKPTHGPPGSGLPEFPTINQAISNIPPGASHHDVENRRVLSKPPYDGNRQAGTITCNGGEDYHPSGKRTFTSREIACLQTFPMEFRFKRNATKQIGNAVPPVLAKAIHEEVVRSLRETDEREAMVGKS